MRQRLSWDAEKVAEIEKKADPYSMNQNHANNPVEKYKNWDTETGGEGVDTKTPWKGEGRTETGHPSPERQAVMAARKLEDKAIKCITIAQRMLPGSADSIIEEQATDLMYLPEKSILSTLQRQASLAEVLAGKKDEKEEEAEECKEAKAEEKPEEKKEEVKEEVKAAVAPEEKKTKPEEVKEEVKEAAKPVEEKKEEVKEEAKEAKKEEVKVEAKKEEVKAAKKEDKEEAKEESKEASADMLDIIFDNAETKTGAKKLSGIVKQASTGDDSLNSLWDCPPDISKAFK